jgi:hypothetical protein
MINLERKRRIQKLHNYKTLKYDRSLSDQGEWADLQAPMCIGSS